MDRTPCPYPAVPNSARIHNFLLGGKDNYKIDQAIAARMVEIAPDTKVLVSTVRQFLVDAVEFIAEAEVGQFIDLGCGYPMSPNVHEVAQKVRPSARVVYVDYDPVVHAHCGALLAQSPSVSALLADIRRPYEIIDSINSESLIDFSKPAAILAIDVLHYVMDEEHPDEIIATFRDAVAPGSYLAFAHLSDETYPGVQSQLHSDTDNTPAQLRYRSASEIRAWMDGFELLGTEIAPAQRLQDAPKTRIVMHCGIGRKWND
ncbi:SAM-dependent methyltransferase [Nocardia vulneris]|uniref:Methyltransferase n=1 Tax=Nocardia vulneris TaxID=1141657 RepID=A0ABR4Z4J9_9NOCA|nr:SAM-dependent methyltransferase [Nocardia vulneris]KIA60250.1 hypothetical protein FG87_38220 [Nocardia vulneris]